MKQEIDFGALKNDAQSVLSQAAQTLDRIQQAVSSSSRQAFNQASDGTSSFMHALDRREPVRFIRRYPVPVTLAAIGVGVVLGALISRSLED